MPDTQARFASLQSGEVDVIWTDRGSSIRKGEADPNLVTIAKDGKGAKITFLNASKPPLDDKRVRQAISYAFNQQPGLTITFKDTVPFATHPFGNASKCDSKYHFQDVKKAKALLDDYYNGGGKPISVEMIHTTTPRGRETGEIMQQLLKKVGIKMTLKPVDQNTLVKRVFTNNYQISGWRIADSNDVGPQIFALSYSKSRYNLTRYKDKTLDKVSYGMRIAKTRAKRDALQCKMAQMINDSAHMLYRGGNRYYVFTGKNVKGVSITSLGRVKVWDAWKE